MFGCVGRIGCLAVLAVAAAGAWLYRDKLVEVIGRNETRPAAVAAVPVWQPVTDEGASRARTAIEALGKKSGPVFTNVRPGDLASYIFIALSRQLPSSAENIEATTIGDRVAVRARVNLADFAQALGPLAMVLGSHEEMQMAGTFEVIRPGLMQFVVRELKFGDLTVPGGAIPKLIEQLRRGRRGAQQTARPEGVSPNGLPLAVPTYIGDVRIAKGKITIYKTTP